jgi:hypothetical protein
MAAVAGYEPVSRLALARRHQDLQRLLAGVGRMLHTLDDVGREQVRKLVAIELLARMASCRARFAATPAQLVASAHACEERRIGRAGHVGKVLAMRQLLRDQDSATNVLQVVRRMARTE